MDTHGLIQCDEAEPVPNRRHCRYDGNMQAVPLFYCDDLRQAVDFYADRLDFALAPDESLDDPVIILRRGDAELMLTSLPGDQVARTNALFLVDDVDALFELWTSRGLDQSRRVESPVYHAPVDQSWGTRELYVTDPFGNTLRLVQRPQRRA